MTCLFFYVYYFYINAINVTNPDLSWRPGNMGRNTLRSPGSIDVSGSVARNIRLWEGHTLNFRMEAFNAINHPNWRTPSADARNAQTFGVVTAARSMRQMQFALKYIF